MWGSAIVYVGLITAVAGFILAIKPIPRLRVTTRRRGLVVAIVGVCTVAVGFFLPAPESRVAAPRTRLDEFMPVWQFQEFHQLRVAAPPSRVFEALEQVRADEIALFNVLTWIRRGGREAPQSILNPGDQDSLIDVATRSGFVLLAKEVPRELVIGTVVVAPPNARGRLTPLLFKQGLAPGFALAAMNFVVEPDGGGSMVTTETRVFANNDAARQRFAAYWRLIYPGSAIIRRMWLRAIARRAINP